MGCNHKKMMYKWCVVINFLGRVVCGPVVLDELPSRQQEKSREEEEPLSGWQQIGIVNFLTLRGGRMQYKQCLNFLFFYQICLCNEVDGQYKESFFFFREMTLCTAHQWSPFLSTSHISFAPRYILLYFSHSLLLYHPVCISEYVIIKWLLVIAWNWFHDIGTTMFFTSNKHWNHK